MLGARVPTPSCLLSSLWPVLLADEVGASIIPFTSWDQSEHPHHEYKMIPNLIEAYLIERKGWARPLLASSSGSAGAHHLAVILESELACRYQQCVTCHELHCWISALLLVIIVGQSFFKN